MEMRSRGVFGLHLPLRDLGLAAASRGMARCGGALWVVGEKRPTTDTSTGSAKWCARVGRGWWSVGDGAIGGGVAPRVARDGECKK